MNNFAKALADLNNSIEMYYAYPDFEIPVGVLTDMRDAIEAQQAPSIRDDTLVDIGGESVPRWVVEYADALTEYHASRGGGSWAIGGVQSREKAPPAARVPDEVARLRQLLAETTAVAITMLYETHKGDVLREFSIQDLQRVVEASDALRPQQVEQIYRRAWDEVAAQAKGVAGGN